MPVDLKWQRLGPFEKLADTTRERRTTTPPLKVPVEERDENGKRRASGGGHSTCGTPQGGVISALLANLYMNRFLKYWRITGRGEMFQAQVLNYADDFVILSRRCAMEALNWTRRVMTRIGLTLNEAKTSTKAARTERFDFLGYTFGPHRARTTGRVYWGASPSQKSVSRLRRKVGDLLQPRHVGPWPEVRDQLHRILRGWSNYFSYGTTIMAHRAVDNYVYARVRNFLRRRHKVPSRGGTQFSGATVFGKLGVLSLCAKYVGRAPVGSLVKSVGKPDARSGHEGKLPKTGP